MDFKSKITSLSDWILEKLRGKASPKAQTPLDIIDKVAQPGGLGTLKGFKKIIEEEKKRRKNASS